MTIQNLEQLSRHGFRDTAVLYDLDRDLEAFEQKYNLSSTEFFQRWQDGKMTDSADFMDWNALYKMAREISL